jgi:hypothetical protein
MIKGKQRKTSASKAITPSSRSRISPMQSELAKKIYTTNGRNTIETAANCLTSIPTVTIPEFWNANVPRYESKVIGPLIVRLKWEPTYAEQIAWISPRRVESRLAGYLDPKEMIRVAKKLESKGEASIRFGAEKTGKGYHGERGDFCLVGGVIQGKHLGLYYRSLELIGGFAYDLTLIRRIGSEFFRDWNTVTICAWRANVFALRKNSNEKLFPKLQEIFREI